MLSIYFVSSVFFVFFSHRSLIDYPLESEDIRTGRNTYSEINKCLILYMNNVSGKDLSFTSKVMTYLRLLNLKISCICLHTCVCVCVCVLFVLVLKLGLLIFILVLFLTIYFKLF